MTLDKTSTKFDTTSTKFDRSSIEFDRSSNALDKATIGLDKATNESNSETFARDIETIGCDFNAMKNFRLSIGVLILVTIFAAMTFAQTSTLQESSASKIALVNTEAFYDKENGIKELVDSIDKLEVELKPLADELNLTIETVQKLGKEIEAIAKAMELYKGFTSKMLEDKLNEYEVLNEKLKKRQAELKPYYEKRHSETVGVVQKKIDEAMQKFAKENGYAIVIDISKLNGSAINENPEEIDITNDFIKYYNENFAVAEMH